MGSHEIEAWKRRIREYRVRAKEDRVKAKTMSNFAALNDMIRDAEMWERMADWEESHPPTTD
jgi:hypothetical protein